MGYSTEFKGVLEFATEITGSQLAHLNKMIGHDIRELDWVERQGDDHFYHMDLEVATDYDGLQWNGSEKSYGMVDVVNTVLYEMRKIWPAFGLVGRLDAQGEEIGDLWALEVVVGGIATKLEYRLDGREVTCPHCEQPFVLDGNPVLIEEASDG